MIPSFCSQSEIFPPGAPGSRQHGDPAGNLLLRPRLSQKYLWIPIFAPFFVSFLSLLHFRQDWACRGAGRRGETNQVKWVIRSNFSDKHVRAVSCVLRVPIFKAENKNHEQSTSKGQILHQSALENQPIVLTETEWLIEKDLSTRAQGKCLKYPQNSNNRTVCYAVENSLLQNRGEKKSYSAPLGAIKNKKPPDLTRGGNSNDIAHGSIIRVFAGTVWHSQQRPQSVNNYTLSISHR